MINTLYIIIILDYVFYAFSSTKGLTGIIICDEEYPQRVAFSLLNKIIDECLIKFPKDSWKTGRINYPELKGYLIKYQDPKQADQIMKVQEQLDETKLVMVYYNYDSPYILMILILLLLLWFFL